MPLFSALLAIGLASAPLQPDFAARYAPVVVETMISAPREEVWRAITTQTGVQSFFARHAVVVTRVTGVYEIYFLPQNRFRTTGLKLQYL